MAEFERMPGAALPFANPPHHTRLRKVASMGFTARAIEAIRPASSRSTASRPRAGGDVIADLALPLPSTVVLEFIGVPPADHARMMQLAKAVIELLAIRVAADAPAVAAAAHAAMN